MNKLNLMLHCGASHVSLDEVASAPTPSPTNTHVPIPHSHLIDQARGAFTSRGLSVVEEAHGLTKNGDRYFGLLQLDSGRDDYGLVVGLRNSHDKSFPAAISLGAGVFVCDNLSFAGEVKLGRRHTRFIQRDLPGFITRAISQLTSHKSTQDTRFDIYKETALDDFCVHDTLIKALDNRVVTPRAIPHVLQEWRSPSHEEFTPRTVWSLYNSFTEYFKKGSLNTTLASSQKLHGLMDGICDLVV